MGRINLLQNNTPWPVGSKTVKKCLVLKRRETVQETKGILGLTYGSVLGYIELVKL